MSGDGAGKFKRGAGRPRLLAIEQIADAVLELGLEQFTMTRLAEKLGVGYATLYEYVDSREELLQIAVQRKAETLPMAIDRGQHWAVFVGDFVHSFGATLIGESEILNQFVASGLGINTEMRIASRFMDALTARGFSNAEAAGLFRVAAYSAIAGAIFAHRAHGAQAKWDQLDSETRSTLEDEAVREFRTHSAQYVADGHDLASDLLRPWIIELARERGESLTDLRTVQGSRSTDRMDV